MTKQILFALLTVSLMALAYNCKGPKASMAEKTKTKDIPKDSVWQIKSNQLAYFKNNLPEEVYNELTLLQNKQYKTEKELITAIEKQIGKTNMRKYATKILNVGKNNVTFPQKHYSGDTIFANQGDTVSIIQGKTIKTKDLSITLIATEAHEPQLNELEDGRRVCRTWDKNILGYETDGFDENKFYTKSQTFTFLNGKTITYETLFGTYVSEKNIIKSGSKISYHKHLTIADSLSKNVSHIAGVKYMNSFIKKETNMLIFYDHSGIELNRHKLGFNTIIKTAQNGNTIVYTWFDKNEHYLIYYNSDGSERWRKQYSLDSAIQKRIFISKNGKYICFAQKSNIDNYKYRLCILNNNGNIVISKLFVNGIQDVYFNEKRSIALVESPNYLGVFNIITKNEEWRVNDDYNLLGISIINRNLLVFMKNFLSNEKSPIYVHIYNIDNGDRKYTLRVPTKHKSIEIKTVEKIDNHNIRLYTKDVNYILKFE